ncbi:MAG: 8-amino-7-oxononanoate synthase [Pirellulales bacterium]
MPDPLDWISAELDQLEKLSLRRPLRQRSSSQSAEIIVDGRRVRNFAANDYLGLCADPRLAQSAAQAAQAFGWGSGASPLVTGRSSLHAECERKLARFKGTEAALLFPSGFAANSGTIPALVGHADVIFSDRANHASIIDGCRLSGAQIVIYDHSDLKELDRKLREAPQGSRRLIVTDSLFSMDGDLAPLADLAELAQRYRAMLMVDEAHATGVLGHRGRGACELLNIESAVHIRLGTLSKALGTMGGFVAGSQPLIDWLANRARSYVFSTAAPAPVAAAAKTALEIVEAEPWRRQELLRRAARLREALADQGWNVAAAAAQIIPVRVGTPDRAVDMSARLQQAGCWVPAIRPPSVPDGGSLLRISLSYLQDDQAVDQLIDALAQTTAAPGN